MTINAIVIPADPAEPARSEQLDTSDGAAYRNLVGGNLQVVELYQPRANLYLHEEGKLIGLPINPRATTLVWLHNRQLRGRDVIAGPAVIVGIPDGDGVDTTAPPKLAALLLDTDRYRVEVQTRGDSAWYGNGLVFPAWFPAYFYAVDLAQRWSQVVDIRVLPAAGDTDQRGRE